MRRLFSSVMTLRQAAAVIFALTAILPLLVFLSYLWRFDLIGRTDAHIGLLLALVIALLGFAVFGRMVDSITRLAHALRDPRAADGSGTPGAAAAYVPGLGQVSEIGDIAQALNRMLEDLRSSTERLEDLVFKLGTLNEMVELAAKIPSIQDLLGHVLERTMRAVRASIGSIMLLDRDRQVLRLAVARGLDDVDPGVEVALGEGVAGKVAEAGEPVLVEDIETDPRFGRANHPRYGAGSFVCLPLRVGDRVVGVVNLARKELSIGHSSKPAAFSSTDFQFLNTLITYMAYAVDNARLLEETRDATRRLQDLVEDQKLRLTLAQQEMVQAAKLSALGQLVAGVAHELNNPLTVLVGAAELLGGDEIPEGLRSRLERMHRAADRAARIVQDLLTFARRRPLQRERIDLAALLDQVLEVTAGELALARVRIEKEVQPGLPTVWADSTQLQQVLINLVTNAAHAMAQVDGDRCLQCSIRTGSRGRVRIGIKDTGCGIAPDLLPSIFDPFVTTKGGKGTGLGLSISYGMIREHGGDVGVDSAVGVGTTFTIDLPVGTAASASPAPAPGAVPELSGRRILVVENDELVRDTVRLYLEKADCQVLAASDADQAFEQLRKHPDLVLLDFHLPGMDGLDFYHQAIARNLGVGTHFLFMTGAVPPETAQQIRRETGRPLLQKPFTRRQLLETLGAALEGRAPERALVAAPRKAREER